MVKNTYVAFPEQGIELVVSAEDALADGINPGDPAVVEVTVREHTIEEWITEVSDGTFEPQHDQGDVAESTSAPVAAGTVEDDRPLIRWRGAAQAEPTAAEPVAAEPVAAEPVAAEPAEAEPMPSTGDDEGFARIHWESGRLAASS